MSKEIVLMKDMILQKNAILHTFSYEYLASGALLIEITVIADIKPMD